MKRCITGLSLSTNSVLSMAKARNNKSDDRPLMPFETPVSSVPPTSGTVFFTSSLVLCVSTPRSANHPWILSSAWLSFVEMSPELLEIPPTTRQKMITPMATSPSRTMIAPPMRGTPWRSSQPTAGPATAPSTAARSTGMHDRRGLVEQPDDPEDDQHEADEQPRREAEVPQPRRSRELLGALGRDALAWTVIGGRSHRILRSSRQSRAVATPVMPGSARQRRERRSRRRPRRTGRRRRATTRGWRRRSRTGCHRRPVLDRRRQPLVVARRLLPVRLGRVRDLRSRR